MVSRAEDQKWFGKDPYSGFLALGKNPMPAPGWGEIRLILVLPRIAHYIPFKL